MEINSILSEFNRSLTLIADKKLLIGNFTSRIRQIMPSEGVYVFLLNEQTGCFVAEGDTPLPLHQKTPLVFNNQGKLFNWLSVN